MKSKLLAMVAAAAVIPLGAAGADDTATVQIDLSASAPSVCYITSVTEESAPSGVSVSPGSAPGVSISGSVDYASELADSVTAIALATTTALKIGAYCNFATHEVGLSSLNGGLVSSNGSPVVGTFHRRINYTATLSNWGALSTSVDTSTTTDPTTNTPTPVDSTPASSASAVNAVADLTIVTAAGSAPLLEGGYTDTLKLTFAPTI